MSVKEAKVAKVAKMSPKFQVLCGLFYYELEHSLEDFEIIKYETYENAAIASLTKALEHFRHEPDVVYQTCQVKIDSNIRNAETRDIINEDIRAIREGTNKLMYFSYGGNHSEYHVKITALKE